MNTKQQYVSIVAICISVILAAAIIAYKPEAPEEDSFRFPVGIPPSIGSISSVQVGEEVANLIYVSGSGSESAQANEATLILGVWTRDYSASDAVDENAELMNAVITAITDLGIPEADMETVTYSVSTEWDYERNEMDGYRVTNLIQIRLNDERINDIGEVIDAATGAGANSIQGISFGLSDATIEQLKAEAYTSALNDAREKADLIAGVLDIDVTGVYSVSESAYYPYRPYMSVDYAVYERGATPIIEGTLSVSVSVQIAFTFE